MDIVTQVKNCLVLVMLVPMGYVFFTSGLVVSLVMLLAYACVWPFNRLLYRKLVNHLAYMYWSQFTFLCQWWSGSNCTLHLEEPDILRYVGRENTIGIMNHKYDIDWIMVMILCERTGLLGGTKVYGKYSLRFVPLIGWIWALTESIFLKRDWEKDRKSIVRDLQFINEYPKNYPVSLLLLCEGTRFTDHKHRISLEVARKKGLPLLKHHLLPRTKAFVLSVQGLKGSVPSILDMTVAFRSDGAAPTLINILLGKACKAEIYLRRIPLEDVPTDTDESCSQWLYKLYQRKDEIYDHFVNNDCYRIGTKVEVPRRLTDLWAYVFWIIVLYIPALYYMGGFLLNGSVLIGLACFVVFAYLGARLMISVTETHRGSQYGKSS